MANPQTKSELDLLAKKVAKNHREAEKLWMKIEKLNAAIQSAREEIKELKQNKKTK